MLVSVKTRGLLSLWQRYRQKKIKNIYLLSAPGHQSLEAETPLQVAKNIEGCYKFVAAI